MWDADSSSSFNRPLLVTTRWYPSGEWADIARSAGQGLRLWRQYHHDTVFADFGDLGSRISGVRLARALRTESSTVRIFLLSDTANEAQRVWARANGANDVLPRQAKVIAQYLSPLEWVSPDPSREHRVAPYLA